MASPTSTTKQKTTRDSQHLSCSSPSRNVEITTSADSSSKNMSCNKTWPTLSCMLAPLFNAPTTYPPRQMPHLTRDTTHPSRSKKRRRPGSQQNNDANCKGAMQPAIPPLHCPVTLYITRCHTEHMPEWVAWPPTPLLYYLHAAFTQTYRIQMPLHHANKLRSATPNSHVLLPRRRCQTCHNDRPHGLCYSPWSICRNLCREVILVAIHGPILYSCRSSIHTHHHILGYTIALARKHASPHK
jgi:hypothetical protein